MLELFKLAATRHEEISKKAFIAPIARLLARAGVKSVGAIAKHPFSALGAGLTTMDIGSTIKGAVTQPRASSWAKVAPLSTM